MELNRLKNNAILSTVAVIGAMSPLSAIAEKADTPDVKLQGTELVSAVEESYSEISELAELYTQKYTSVIGDMTQSLKDNPTQLKCHKETTGFYDAMDQFMKLEAKRATIGDISNFLKPCIQNKASCTNETHSKSTDAFNKTVSIMNISKPLYKRLIKIISGLESCLNSDTNK